MKILLLGSGGREHALAWKIAQSPKVEKLYIAPGNAGTTAVGENVNIKATDFEAISAFALKENIQMIVVGPEDPLVKGIYDYFQNRPELKHIAVIGPSAQGAQLEGIDVSWKRFKKVEDEDGRPLQDVGSDTLKLVLSEVLRDLRQAEKCYIKYELKQGCFHITAR